MDSIGGKKQLSKLRVSSPGKSARVIDPSVLVTERTSETSPSLAEDRSDMLMSLKNYYAYSMLSETVADKCELLVKPSSAESPRSDNGKKGAH